MNSISIKYYNSPFGELIIGSYKNEIVLCDWRYRKMREAIDKRIKTALSAEYIKNETSVIEETIRQLEEYFTEKRERFTIPLRFEGTSFQKTVWQALLDISYGKTESYLGLSKMLGNQKAIRAVATANGANAISILVPCHRIVGSKNELTGYAGGLTAKKKLLKLEKCPAFSQQLGLF